MFRFKTNSNKIEKDPKIIWKFESIDQQFESEASRFERNVEFWRQKFNLSKDEMVVTLNGVIEPIEYTEFEDLKTEIADEPTINPQLAIEFTGDLVSEEPGISKDIKAPVNTPIKKSRKKTPKL
jgi:hypothetical protein